MPGRLGGQAGEACPFCPACRGSDVAGTRPGPFPCAFPCGIFCVARRGRGDEVEDGLAAARQAAPSGLRAAPGPTLPGNRTPGPTFDNSKKRRSAYVGELTSPAKVNPKRNRAGVRVALAACAGATPCRLRSGQQRAPAAHVRRPAGRVALATGPGASWSGRASGRTWCRPRGRCRPVRSRAAAWSATDLVLDASMQAIITCAPDSPAPAMSVLSSSAPRPRPWWPSVRYTESSTVCR